MSVYRKEIFNEIINHIKNNPDINNIIIGGDYNQNLNNNEVKRFQEAIGIYEIHPIINNVQINQIGKTYIHGSNPIDSLATSQGIIDYIDRCKLLSNNDIIELDHYSYIIDVALEDYFDDELSEWDNINKVLLNLARRSHREKFIEELEHQLEIYNVENDLNRMEILCLNQEIE